MKKLIPLFVIISTALFTGVVSAKGLFPTVTIYNPSTDTTVELAENASESLRQFFLFDWESGEIAEVPDLENGFEIRRGSVENGQFEPFDMLVYYPATEEHPGYVHYIGLIDHNNRQDGWSEYDNNWYFVNSLIENELNTIVLGETVEQVTLPSHFWQTILDKIRH